jgi:hypothetical protein
MRTQKDFLQEVFARLNEQHRNMSTGELRLLEYMELRASEGPVLTSHDISYLHGWVERLIKRGKSHDDLIAGNGTSSGSKSKQETDAD